jgi:hypothetical protein
VEKIIAMYEKVIIICGMPRSGTSWVGQIFDSSPDVAFRMEPLFAYGFKNVINLNSSKDEIEDFLYKVYQTDDDFIHQKENRKKGLYPTFNKNQKLRFLVLKTTRHHHLLENYLKKLDHIEIISIVRHPCATISSWMNTDREFKLKGCVAESDWKTGECRKDGVGEYWGFNDWLAVTQRHVDLSEKYENFRILKYADLVKHAESVVSHLFDDLSIAYTDQTVDFLNRCHESDNDDPYSVFKGNAVENKWKTYLNGEISNEIIDKTKAANLERFL